MKKKHGFKIILLGTIIFIFFKFSSVMKRIRLRFLEILSIGKGIPILSFRVGHKERERIAEGNELALFNVGDPTETFIVYRSFLDNALYVREDFKISTEGRITKLSWGYKIFTDKDLCDTISKILEESKNLEINMNQKIPFLD